eukprot:3733960-Rhodomonas_salina.1
MRSAIGYVSTAHRLAKRSTTERERARARNRERETERETETQKDTETQRRTLRERERERERERARAPVSAVERAGGGSAGRPPVPPRTPPAPTTIPF